MKHTERDIDFISNDFLGFSRSPVLLAKTRSFYEDLQSQYSNFRIGAGGSVGIIGGHPFLSDLEQKIAEYHKTEAAFVSHCGYMANLGLCCLVSSDDVMLWDEGVHISIRHGARAVLGIQNSFPHYDMNALEDLLKKYYGQCRRIFIFISSVNSCDGEKAPLETLVFLSRKYSAYLILDEAHAFGIYGDQGLGLAYEKFSQEVYASLVTYGKVFGGFGAAILSNKLVKEDLTKQAWPLIYSTAMPLPVLAAIDQAYEYNKVSGDALRKRLFSLRDYYCSFFPSKGRAGVHAMYFPCRDTALQFTGHLKEAGIRTSIMKAYGDAVIRINLHTFNTEREIGLLYQCYQQWTKERGEVLTF